MTVCSAVKKQTDIIGRTQDNMKITNLLPVKVCARQCEIDPASSVSISHRNMPLNLDCISFMQTVRREKKNTMFTHCSLFVHNDIRWTGHFCETTFKLKSEITSSAKQNRPQIWDKWPYLNFRSSKGPKSLFLPPPHARFKFMISTLPQMSVTLRPYCLSPFVW